MGRTNSTNWAVNETLTAERMQDFNEDLDDLYEFGSDRGRVLPAASGTALKIDVGAFNFRIGANEGQSSGITDFSVTDNSTNYIEVNSSGTIVNNTTGWVGTNAKLGKVITSGGVITSISIFKTDAIGGEAASIEYFIESNLTAGENLSKGDFYRYGISGLGETTTKMYKTTTDTLAKSTARGIVMSGVLADNTFTGLTNGTLGGYSGLLSLVEYLGSYSFSHVPTTTTYGAVADIRGQTFTMDATIKLTNIGFSRYTAPSSNTFYIDLYDSVGTLLGTSNPYTASAQGTYYLTFPVEHILTNGTQYEFRIRGDNINGTIGSSTVDGYAGGNLTKNGVAQTGDLRFWINGIPQVSAEIDSPLYIQDDGTLNLIAGTNEASAGTIVSDTELRVTEKMTGSISDTATTGSISLGNAEGYVVVKINGVDKKIPYYGV